MNEPGVIARLIRIALESGWDPPHARQPYVVENGLEWLDRLGVV